MTHPDLWIVDDLKSTQGYILGGNYNGMGCRLLCAVGTSVVCLKYSKWWIINVIPVTLISIVTLATVQSMTSLTGILLFLLFCFIPSRKLLKTGIITLIATVIFFQIFVCFQGKGIEHNSLIVWFVEDVLDKDITFTHRTYMWDAASKVFVDSPIYGYGLVDADWYYSHMSSFAKGPHNFIWGILIYGGIILLALFTYICYMAFIKLPATNDKSVLLIYAVAATMFTMMIMEVYPLPFIITLITFAYFAPRSQEVIEPTIPNTV
jgi:O-antigen ligase